MLKDKRVYVTCQTDDDLDYILGYAGEDNLVIGTDYGHSDNASEIEALRKIRNEGKFAAHVIDKILDDNRAGPVRFVRVTENVSMFWRFEKC